MKEDIVLKAFIDVYKSKKDVLDIMESVNSSILKISKVEFSNALYSLQQQGKISGVIFENDDPSLAILWDDLSINTENFKTYEE